MNIFVAIFVGTVAALALTAASAAAQGAAPATGSPTGVPQPVGVAAADLSGFWELRHDSFSVPRAALTPEAQKAEAQQAQRDLQAIQRCVPMGVPALMLDRPVLNIQQSPSVIGMIPKGPASVRYVHLTHPHPPSDEWEGATNGHSIGKWEGDTLVVETIGFNDRGVTSIPGGGWRNGGSKLTERYRLLSGGLVLSVTSTWEDPEVFAKPHTYELRYYRVPPANEPRTHNCIAGDQERTKFLSSGAVLVR
jgi:hypothetical protein